MVPSNQLAISPYRIEVPLDATESILYSTLTTSLVVMENEVLKRVFSDGDFSDSELCSELLEMGFLYDSAQPQQELLRQTRQEVMEADTGVTGVTIAPTMACNARCYYCFEHGARWGTMSQPTRSPTSSSKTARQGFSISPGLAENPCWHATL